MRVFIGKKHRASLQDYSFESPESDKNPIISQMNKSFIYSLHRDSLQPTFNCQFQALHTSAQKHQWQHLAANNSFSPNSKFLRLAKRHPKGVQGSQALDLTTPVLLQTSDPRLDKIQESVAPENLG